MRTRRCWRRSRSGSTGSTRPRRSGGSGTATSRPKSCSGKGQGPLTAAANAAEWLAADRYAAPDPRGVVNAHGDDIRAVSWTIDRPIPAGAFDFWMATLIELAGPDILRFKGVIHVEGLPWPFAAHGVQHIFHPPVPLKDWDGVDRRTRMVVIARGFSNAELHQAFRFLDDLSARPEDATYLAMETPA